MINHADTAVNFLYETFAKLSDFFAIKTIRKVCPKLIPERIISSMLQLFQKDEKRLIFHVNSLIRKTMEISLGRGISEKDMALTLVAILYHDAGKIIDHLVDDAETKRIIDVDLFGHSLAMRRFFLWMDLPELAQAVRHHSTDFVVDIRGHRVTIPQFLLNIVDRLDESGVSVSPEQKMLKVKERIGNNIGFDFNSETVACHIVREALHFPGKFSELGFICKQAMPSRSILFTQRFDGKYCAPVGKYRDTSSNIAIADHLSRWGWKSTLLHEGDFGEVEYNGGTIRIVGIRPIGNDCIVYQPIVEQISDHEVVIIEGWTTGLSHLRAFVPTEKSFVLLLRTMSRGRIEEDRLSKIGYADEIWVMTDEMKKIIGSQLTKDISVRILQSGINEEIFFINNSAIRQRGKIVYVGAVTALKGVDVLVDAFREVRSLIPEAELHIIGTPEIYGRVNEFSIANLNDCEGICYHGVLESREIAQHLQTAHIAVLLTKIYETWGKSAMQARCCGARMLVSNSGALPFHVQSSEEGIVLSSITKESVTESILRLLGEEPRSVARPEDRYHSWKLTAINLVTYLDMLERKKQYLLGNNVYGNC